jgi:protocatechuate 3,4-dioxygenase beta subunit
MVRLPIQPREEPAMPAQTFELTPGPISHRTFDGRPLPHPDEPVFDQGLQFDVETLIDRRAVLKVIGLGAASAAIAACVPSVGSAGPSATLSAGATTAPAASAAPAGYVIPEETAGPYPGDGSNGPDILDQSGVVRADIRSSFGSSTTVATGVPLTIRLAIRDQSSGAPLAGYGVYVWHCDQQGRYSMYSQGATAENYLRGVQAAGSDGVATFQSVFPACYSGRWPHIHFEVYPSVAKATDVRNKIATSQIALPEATCQRVYATTGYEQSVSNLSQVSLASDMVFSDDGAVHELGAISGSVSSGLTVDLAVPVRAG